jgi:predicted transcriptional regulator
MTQAELVKMLISRVNAQQEQVKCLKIELEEAQAVNRELKGTVRTTVDALSVAKGGYQVRKQNQGTVENLRLSIEGLLTAPDDQREQAVTFATKIMSLTETEVSF